MTLVKPAEREWVKRHAWLVRSFVLGAFSVLIPAAVSLGLLIGFTVN